MYICKPERNVKQTRILLFTCIFVTLSLFFASTVVPKFHSFVEFCGFAALAVSILLIVRYSLTEFEYAVGNGDFSVTKIVGNKRTVVCVIALESAVGLYTQRDYDHLPSSEKAIIKYSLNQNMGADCHVFLCVFNGKRTMVRFEPNNAFAAIVRDEIRKSKQSSENEN